MQNSQQTLEHILAAKKYGDLFTFSQSDVKIEYRDMARLIHPDVCKDTRASEAMSKLNAMYNLALEALQRGTGWEVTNRELIPCIGVPNRTHISVSYRVKDTFEFGDRYVCDNSVLYVFRQGCEKYWKNASKMIKGIKYPNRAIEQEIGRFIPKLTMEFDTMDGGHGLVFSKPCDVYPLDLFLAKYGNGLDDRHVAWIISRLCNLSCFFQVVGVSYNAFQISNLFICPDKHSISLIGGWWYATPVGQKMIGVPHFVHQCMPEHIRFKKVGSCETDLESVKGVARLLAVDSKPVPDPINRWMSSGSTDNAITEYKRWSKALNDAYGERKFVQCFFEPNKIYE